MATLTDADIKRPSQREYATTLEDEDVFVMEDVSEQKIKPITKTNAKATLGITDAEVMLADHETRLDTLEADDTTEGSVAKSVKDAVEPIIEDVDDHETRLDTTELTLARQGQDLASVKQTLQQGNGAILDFSDIGQVALDARATGRANPTVEGLTATNLVNGADIPDLGTVTFASVLNHKYFDVLHGTILTGTGSDMTVTNDTGAIKNIAVVNLTSIYGAGNEPSEADCAKIFSSYFSGTKSIQLPARVLSVSEDESETSTLYIADNEEVRSVPAISDEVKVVNGQLVKVQNVQRYVLQESDVRNFNGTNKTNFDYVQISTNVIGYSLTSAIQDGKTTMSGFAETYSATLFINDDPAFVGRYDLYTSGANFTLGVEKGKYASLAEAQADLAGTVIYYQLATPIITPLTTSGILQAKPNGTVYYEPYYEGSHQTNASSQITLPYEGTIEAVYGYDENLEPYEVPSTGYTLVGTTLTVTGAVENEVYYVELSRSEPLAPEMGVNVINNEQVTLDTVNGKYYKITHTTANGVPTTVATEVV
jgi:hypothetical protein